MNKSGIPVIILATATVILPACGALPGGDEGQPTATILSPASGSSVPVNEPLSVQVQAADPDGPGVFRIDVQLDGVTVNSFEAAGPQASLTAELSITPAQEGAVTVAAIAFRQDGTASPPATIALSVVGATVESPPASDSEEAASSGEGQPEPPPPPDPSDPRAAATANLDVPIREQCGPGCPQIGVWTQGTEGDFLIRTTSPTQWWYWTDYLGENQLGCVYQGQEQVNFTPLEPDDALPREPEQGCFFCGDGICSEEIGEACDECAQDCGVCPFCGDGVVNQDSEACDGDASVCGEGFTCSTSCGCEEIPEPDPQCGNGILEPGEECDGDASVCGGVVLQTCSASCTCEDVQIAFCGDGVCQGGEDVCSCPADCGIGCIK